MSQRSKVFLIGIYVMATIQLVWCYLWLTRPYVNTALYEAGRERMPFQGRALMMLPLRLAHSAPMLRFVPRLFALSPFWFRRQVPPEVLVQAVVDVAALLLTGWLTTRIYQQSSRRQLLTPLVYPMLLAACAATYILHTVQNFRFIYDLPSLMFFAIAFYLLYFRWHPLWFCALFLLATTNRETTLLLLPIFAIDSALENGHLRWARMLRPRTLAVVLPLLAFWIAWQAFIRIHFSANASEFYPRFDWNIKSLLLPQAWPQLLSSCGYLLLLVVFFRRRIPDVRLRSWLWILPFWIAFMFSFGILIETRIFGELIPLLVCTASLLLEEALLAHALAIPAQLQRTSLESRQPERQAA